MFMHVIVTVVLVLALFAVPIVRIERKRHADRQTDAALESLERYQSSRTKPQRPPSWTSTSR